MKRRPVTLMVHLLLIIAMLALCGMGCEEEEAVSPTTTPEETMVPGETAKPSPTVSPSPTPAVSPTPAFEYPDEPPQLPPSFGLDADMFSSLPDTVPSAETIDQGALLASINIPGKSLFPSRAVPGDQAHWNHAAGNVLIWSAVIVAGLSVPVAAFVASFNNIPYKESPTTWIWSYDVNIGNKKHTAELHGTYVPNGVEWEMYISKEGEYTGFLWFNGESDLAGTEGYWIMKENPSNPNDLLRIDWQRDPAAGTNEIKYENIKPGAPEKGGYIITRVTGESPYDASWDIYNKGRNNHTYIEWNRETEAGRVKDSNRFGNSDWHCWGTDHKNTDC